MNKVSERYNTKVEIPISVILETVFSTDNKDVETLSRWAKKYGFVDLVKEDGEKLGYYKLQDDYTKQSFYIWLSKKERKQYDYEDYLIDKLQQKENIIKEVREYIEEHYTVKKEENIYMTEDTKGLLEILNGFLKILDKENSDGSNK